MTNGSKEVTQKFLFRSKLDFVSPVLDVEGPRAWKPCRAAYQYVVDQLGLPPEQVLLCTRCGLSFTNGCHKHMVQLHMGYPAQDLLMHLPHTCAFTSQPCLPEHAAPMLPCHL